MGPCYTKVKATSTLKRTSLLHLGVGYRCKKFCRRRPKEFFDKPKRKSYLSQSLGVNVTKLFFASSLTVQPK